MKKNVWVVLLTVLLSTGATIAMAAPADDNKNLSVNERLERLERLVNSSALVDVVVRVESIQSELQHLLGELEVQKHTLEEIKKRQRDLYLDIDRRLLQIERRSGTSTPGISSAMPSAPTANSPAPTSMNNNQQVPVQAAINVAPVVAAHGKKEGEQVAYQKAFDLLRALRYDKATQAFRQFLNDYPRGRYAHIAQYWLAETSYHTRKYDVAVKDYQALIEHYPKSPKRADALLKIGYSQFELKDFPKSKAVLEKLMATYPGTTEAGQAQNLLQKIRLQKIQ